MNYIIMLFLVLVSCSETGVSKVQGNSKKEGGESQKKYVDDPIKQGEEREKVTHGIKKRTKGESVIEVEGGDVPAPSEDQSGGRSVFEYKNRA